MSLRAISTLIIVRMAGIGGSYVTSRTCLVIALFYLASVVFLVIWVDVLGQDRSYFEGMLPR